MHITLEQLAGCLASSLLLWIRAHSYASWRYFILTVCGLQVPRTHRTFGGSACGMQEAQARVRLHKPSRRRRFRKNVWVVMRRLFHDLVFDKLFWVDELMLSRQQRSCVHAPSRSPTAALHKLHAHFACKATCSLQSAFSTMAL